MSNTFKSNLADILIDAIKRQVKFAKNKVQSVQ